MMVEFITGTLWLALLITFMWSGSSCQEDIWRKGVIEKKGFCLSSEVSGQKFEKCYELREKAGE